MTWGLDPASDTFGGPQSGKREAIELVGTHLRLDGTVTLGRFSRLSDYINSSSGYVRVLDARLLRRNGEPTTLVLPELMVDQDEISFIAQADPDRVISGDDTNGHRIRVDAGDVADAPEVSSETEVDVWAGLGGAPALSVSPSDRDPWGPGSAAVDRPQRSFVMFTPGHTVTGKVLVYGGTDIAGFVDAREPRFVPVTDVTARSLADRRVISHFKFVLLNRTHMIAASEVGRRGDMNHADLPEL